MNLDGVLFVGPRSEFRHVMWFKMLQRAGLEKEKVHTQALDTFTSLPSNFHTIITLGEQSLNQVLGEYNLFRWHGRLVESFKHNCIIMPIMQPSELLPFWGDDERPPSPLYRKPSRFQGMWVRHVQHAIKNEGKSHRFQTNYTVDPPLYVWNQIVQGFLARRKRLSFDIETIYKIKISDEEEFEADELPIGAIIRISFSDTPYHAVSVSWSHPYLDGIRELLASSLDKIGWNCAMFDVPRLEDEGYPVNGTVYDGMDAFHLLRSEQPMGLEYTSSIYTPFMPWKHLNLSNPGQYSCIDADSALICFMGIEQDLRTFAMWDLYMRHSVQLMPILREAGIRGNLVDLEYSRQLEAELLVMKKDMEARVQTMVPQCVKPRKRYKTCPWEKTDEIAITNGIVLFNACPYEIVMVEKTVNVCSHCNAVVSNKTEHFKGGKKNNACKANSATLSPALREVPEWDQLLDFNLNSSDQIKDYIRHFNHKMGKDRKTDHESANSKHLEKLAKEHGEKHPLYKLRVEYSKVAKTISTYIYYHYADNNGVIHTTYVNAPSTWRLASRAVNLQNVGKKESNPWAKKARRQIIARPGHVFVQADSTSIEAVCLGVLIGDKQYIKLASKSIHAWLACLDLGIEFNDANVSLVKKNHKALYDKFKVANYLLLYGGDPYLMFMTEPETFPTVEDARKVQQRIFDLIPKLKQWQESIREQAKKDGYLISPWNYRHYFFDVYTFKKNKKTGKIEFHSDGKPKIKMGQDGKTALAFKPQNSAAAFMRDTTLLIGASKWRQYMPANISVHDGYTLEVPKHLAVEAAEFLISILTRPVVELGGIQIGCEVEIGENWADWDEKENPKGLKKWKKVEMENE